MQALSKATKLETDMLGYRARMHTLFKECCSNIDVSEQRVADQRYAIVKRRLMSHVIVERIRSEIEEELRPIDESGRKEKAQQCDNNRQHNNEVISEEISPELQPDPTQEQENTVNIQIEDPKYTKLRELLENNLNKYGRTEPTQRPKIPNHGSSNKLAQVNFSNEYLWSRNSADLPLHELKLKKKKMKDEKRKRNRRKRKIKKEEEK
ncbi:unnamed protein product [Psylliodes chrysocephalus]|uniref:Uncharacterized protein n=1 Tax=Psylliodes chrysocephalus TaxID=3402493 RepID=A0A9P0CZC5_9CUCU|nr:unnamed protein product [Psylliodes chrysocephala]